MLGGEPPVVMSSDVWGAMLGVVVLWTGEVLLSGLVGVCIILYYYNITRHFGNRGWVDPSSTPDNGIKSENYW